MVTTFAQLSLQSFFDGGWGIEAVTKPDFRVHPGTLCHILREDNAAYDHLNMTSLLSADDVLAMDLGVRYLQDTFVRPSAESF